MRENCGEMILIGLRFDDLPNQKKARLERFLCEDKAAVVGDVVAKIHEFFQDEVWFPAGVKAEHSTLTCSDGCNIDFKMPVAVLSQPGDAAPQMLAVRWRWPNPKTGNGQTAGLPKPSSPEGHECRTCGLSKPRTQFGWNQFRRRNSPRCRGCCIGVPPPLASRHCRAGGTALSDF